MYVVASRIVVLTTEGTYAERRGERGGREKRGGVRCGKRQLRLTPRSSSRAGYESSAGVANSTKSITGILSRALTLLEILFFLILLIHGDADRFHRIMRF